MDERKDPHAPPEKGGLLHSAPPPNYTPPATFQTSFACVSLHMTDRIRLLRFPSAHVQQITAIVKQTWTRGIQVTRPYDASNEIKLRGNPWSSSNGFWGDDRIHARRLVCAILAGLFDLGWVLKASVDISKKEYDKDTLLFRRQTPPPPRCRWICFSFDKGDRLRLIDSPSELNNSILAACGVKVQSSKQVAPGNFEIKFRGWPWQANGTETVQARLLLLTLLECLEQHGFSLYASIDQDCGPGGDSRRTEADTWFCNRQLDWQPGAPIYHS